LTKIAPVRLQLSRRKGFDLQVWSREVNGLDVVNCARPAIADTHSLGSIWRAMLSASPLNGGKEK
jgi:hypothetical protein